MKKITYLSIFYFLCVVISYGQTITLTFLGRDAVADTILPLENVLIQNTTLGCDTMIYGESPSIVLTSSLGIDDPDFTGSESFIILPPVPNPFNETTSVRIILNQEARIQLTVLDSKGISIAEYENNLPGGLNRFEIRSSLNDIMLLSISDGSIVKSLKLISNGNGIGRAAISYLGFSEKIYKTSYVTAGFKWLAGNQLLYKSVKAGYNDAIITDSPVQNSDYTFNLTRVLSLPSVLTAVVTDTTHNAAICGGNVIADGGSAVTSRGVCWSTFAQPTTSDNLTIDGSGLGAFESNLTGLTPNTFYYVRAYALNSIGTAYGDELTFTTLPYDTLPGVTTASVIILTDSTATCGGNVTSNGGSPVTSRGVCWNTSPDPTTDNNYTVDGSGYGTFESYLTGLTSNTPYYARAYATNGSGTAYGNELSFFLSDQQIENTGFEYWEDAGTVKDEPVDWSSVKTCDDPPIGSIAPVTFDQSADAHSGNYSLKLYNVSVFGIVVTGAITNGRFHAEYAVDSSYAFTQPDDPKWHMPFTWRPDSLTGWFKYFPQGNDAAQVKVILHNDEGKIPENGTLPHWIGMAEYDTPGGETFDTWTRFAVPFAYYSEIMPEFLLIVINSGAGFNAIQDSYLLIDDLELKYTALEDHNIKKTKPLLLQK